MGSIGGHFAGLAPGGEKFHIVCSHFQTGAGLAVAAHIGGGGYGTHNGYLAALGQILLADFFRISAWRQLGENCSRYLAKGKKVCVVGPVSLRTFRGRDGTEKSILEVTANDVEFLSPRTDDAAVPAPQAREDAPARAPQQMSLTHPGNIDRQEQAYLSAEREAIRNEKKYVVVNDSEELPF